MDADPCFVRVKVILLEKTHIVGRHYRNVQALSRLQRRSDPILFTRPTGARQFQIKTLRESLQPGMQHVLAQGQRGARILHKQAVDSARQSDQAITRRIQPRGLQQGQALNLPLLPGPTQQASQVTIPGRVLRQQRQTPGGTIGPDIGQPNVGTHDRLHPGTECRLVKLHQAKQIHMVSHRDRRHPDFRHLPHERLEANQAIDQGKLRVHAQMNKTGY